MIQIKHIFGYHSSDAKETFPVEAQCDASRALIENVLDNGSELVTNVRLAADHLQVQHRYVYCTWEYIVSKIQNLKNKKNSSFGGVRERARKGPFTYI